MAVVAHHNHGILERVEEVFQPEHALGVQVVGRFVEQQHVGVAKQGLGQQYAHFLAGPKVGHQRVVLAFHNAEAGEQLGGLVLGIPAFEVGKLAFQLGGALAVGIRKIGLGIQRLLLGHHRIQALVALNHGLQHRLLVVGKLVLLEHGQALAGRHFHRAGVGLQLAGQDFQERGFARAVGPDEAVAVARQEFGGNVFKQDALAIAQAHIGGRNHSVRKL